MTALARAFRRIGSPAAVSWPTFWVSLAFNFFLAFAGSFNEAAGWQRLVVVVTSQATMWGVLLLCRATVLRELASRPQPWRTLACFILAGITRSLTAAGVFVAFLGVEELRLGPRIAAGVVVGIIAFVPATIIVASWREYRARRTELLARQEQLAAAAERLVSGIAERDRSVVDQVRTQVDEALALADPAPELQRWSTDVLRPLSHQLAAGMCPWAPPHVAPGLVRMIDVVRRAVVGAPLMPLTTAMSVALLAFIPMLLAFDWPTTLAFTVVVITGGGALVWVANRVLSRLGRAPAAARMLLVLTLLGISGWVVGRVSLAVLLPERDLTFVFLPSLVGGFVVLGVALALARALSAEAYLTLQELEDADARLEWQVARLGLLQWAQGLRFARALHGPVQGIVSTAVARLRHDPHKHGAILGELRASVLEVLDGDAPVGNWTTGVDQLRRTWEGFCEITVTAQESAVARLDQDSACRALALEILTEAVSNSVRHAGATAVEAALSGDGDRVSLIVTDNGGGLTSGLPGLGTRVLDECTLEWSREASPEATRVYAVLPVIT